MKRFAFAALTALAVLLPQVEVRAAADEEKFQIVKATDSRVWRLNKQTGEIAVCSLDGTNLVCTTSSEAIRPPKKSFEENQAEKRQALSDEQKRRDEDLNRDLAMIDKIIEAFRGILKSMMEREAATAK